MEKVYISKSYKETQELAYKIGSMINEPMVFLLDGDLGAGKTTFTQGLAKGLDITKTVSSPTFTIMKNYNGRMKLNHIDAYRLESLHQDLGLDELIGEDGVTVIEWATYVEELFPEEYLKISVKRLNENKREFHFYPKGIKYEKLIEEIL
ncbi:MAG TPA: tRNA (adenosine(37)-N6)-threonylcarbamoyltransferase complex ATPase subunit type 1 TsaE [Erysipelotrichaceae bacterium]|jgi:tRNA threonylcarbamoyladenosine biosynthesis protein TsaE|nr:tRNA (adenosine(37)-N6)-threonylcarbamoyltransferase complex ATPase subunit type 1 TsaE [Erysipelotrichaceae bacterium]